jgi:hypothetical protein
MYEDGSIDPDTFEVLKMLKVAFRDSDSGLQAP